jgi:catechol 2,3-dioxygenase-like lactoylglutathione lyase family enzyme
MAKKPTASKSASRPTANKTAKSKKAPAKPRKAAAALRPKQSPPRSSKETPGLRLTSMGAGLTVNDIEKSLIWYRDVLGLSAGERWEREGKLAGVEMKAGKVSIWIGQDDWKKGRDRVKGEGFRMYCETDQDIDRIAEGIKARGGVLDHEPKDQPWGGREFALADPDGFKITFMTSS